MESTQHKLDRVRPPRVQITYDVEIGDAIQVKELPLVVGILADLSGKRAEALPALKARKFVEIDRDNFDEVMDSIAPRAAIQVDNRLADDDTKLNVELVFRSMDDFEPVSIVKQVKPLARLLEARSRLRDLMTKLDGNDELDALLGEIIDNAERKGELEKDLEAAGVGKADDEEPKADA
jgi:type VI secretion system protein ImpB